MQYFTVPDCFSANTQKSGTVQGMKPHTEMIEGPEAWERFRLVYCPRDI